LTVLVIIDFVISLYCTIGHGLVGIQTVAWHYHCRVNGTCHSSWPFYWQQW